MERDRKDQLAGMRSPACAGEVDRLCDAFEQQWKAGKRPDVGAYLDRVDAHLRPELLRELVALEVTYRRCAGEDVGLTEYQQRFPAHAGK